MDLSRTELRWAVVVPVLSEAVYEFIDTVAESVCLLSIGLDVLIS